MAKFVLKANGEKERFSAEKIYRSARRVGASNSLAKAITKEIEREAYSGIKTSEIFRKVRRSLKKRIPRTALRFNLKEGIRRLGPTGFPFEKYIGEIFSKNGFKVKLNQHISGYCCGGYEIDFLAEKDNLIYVGECKYRNLFKGKVHSEVALANYARFLDIKKGEFLQKTGKKVKSLLVTNRKFTSRAVEYSNCVGVSLLGWNYPADRGLEYLIETKKLYPITILPSLGRSLAQLFASKKIMLVEDILKYSPEGLVKEVRISEAKLKKLRREAETLLE